MPNQLVPHMYSPLPIGTIQPRGWLRRQLRLQADGLSGHLDEFWPDVSESGWIGGDAEGWERGPYWLDGIIPLAFALNDATLIAKARYWIDTILSLQEPDGWLGPRKSPEDKYEAHDVWPSFVALKALAQYQEATGDERIIPAMQRCLRRIYREVEQTPLYVWGKSRWADLVLSIHWLYDRTKEPWLLEMADLVHDQGYDWNAHFADFRWKRKLKADECVQETHVVNNAMALKAGAVWLRQSKEPDDAEFLFEALHTLDEYHGQANGMWSGDEHYAGKSPSQGTELCAVVEAMYSLHVAYAILGEPWIADRLEQIAFNALPATFSDDMWGHQYDQQVNQVVCKVFDKPIWTNNGPDSNTFGLEPNYGCCTANLSQGWPKFANSLWMTTRDGGLAVGAYAPCQFTTKLGGAQVTVTVETDYPFDETIGITVETDQRALFPIYLRVPEWASQAYVRLGDDIDTELDKGPGTVKLDGPWVGATEITLTIPLPIMTDRSRDDGITVQRGPILYALDVGTAWRQIAGSGPTAQYEVLPAGPWNWGLVVDRDADEEEDDMVLMYVPQYVNTIPWFSQDPPGTILCQARRVPGWRLRQGVAAPPPKSPAKASGDSEPIRLIPYGCAKLRVAVFPTVDPDW